MKIWVDAQLSPAIAQWLTAMQGVEATALRDLGLQDAEDSPIFFAARHQGAIVMSRDRDFVDLVLNTVHRPRSSGSPVGTLRTRGFRRSLRESGLRWFNS